MGDSYGYMLGDMTESEMKAIENSKDCGKRKNRLKREERR